jgi:hypothetical protein
MRHDASRSARVPKTIATKASRGYVHRSQAQTSCQTLACQGLAWHRAPAQRRSTAARCRQAAASAPWPRVPRALRAPCRAQRPARRTPQLRACGVCRAGATRANALPRPRRVAASRALGDKSARECRRFRSAGLARKGPCRSCGKPPHFRVVLERRRKPGSAGEEGGSGGDCAGGDNSCSSRQVTLTMEAQAAFRSASPPLPPAPTCGRLSGT